MELQASSAVLLELDAKGEVLGEREIPIELVQVNDILKVVRLFFLIQFGYGNANFKSTTY